MALPSDLLDEILFRLPVKDLLRSRCVSKGWCSLIDSTPFVIKHLKKALEFNVGGLIINQRGKFYLAEDFKSNLDGDSDDVVAVEISNPLKTLLSGAEFVGSANGLVCLSKNMMNNFLVFNPSTRKLRKIPSFPAEFPRSFHMTETSLCGFGYDPVNDDYKLVKICECYLQFRGKMAIVYSLKTNSWKWIRNVPAHNTRFFGNWGMFASGTLNWLAIDNPINGSDIIVGFDLGLEQFKEFPCPVFEGPVGNFETRSMVSDGSFLYILDKYPNSHIDVWVMLNSCGEENSWSKILRIKEHSTLGCSSFVRPVYFSRSGQSVLFEVDGTEIVWYDLGKKTVKNVRIYGPTNEFDSHVYTSSLIQLHKGSLPPKPVEDKAHKEHQKRRDDFLSSGFKLRL